MKDFDLACLELKQNGKGFINNYDEIEDEGKYSVFSAIFSFRTLLGHFFYKLIKNNRGIPQNEVLADAGFICDIIQEIPKLANEH